MSNASLNAAAAEARRALLDERAAAWSEGFEAGSRWAPLDDEWYEDSQVYERADLPPRPPKPANPYAHVCDGRCNIHCSKASSPLPEPEGRADECVCGHPKVSHDDEGECWKFNGGRDCGCSAFEPAVRSLPEGSARTEARTIGTSARCRPSSSAGPDAPRCDRGETVSAESKLQEAATARQGLNGIAWTPRLSDVQDLADVLVGVGGLSYAGAKRAADAALKFAHLYPTVTEEKKP